MQRVERVEEFLLDAFLAGEKLNVVDQQDIGLPVFFAETDELVVLNGVNVFVGEFFRRKVSDARPFFVSHDILPDGLQQMRLAQPHAAVEKQRVVRFPRCLCDRQRRSVRKTVVVADNEGVECVSRIESVVAASGDRLLGYLNRFRFRRFAFADGCRAGLCGNDLELHLQGLAASVHQHVLNQAEIVVFKPDFAKIIRHFQSHLVTLQRTGPHRCEPEVVDVRVEHRA